MAPADIGCSASALIKRQGEERRWRVCHALFVVALLLATTTTNEAYADSLADLRQPSSTIPGCANDWGPLGTGADVVEPTCEGKAALAEWNQYAATVNAARDTLVNAANWPDKADPRAVLDALKAAAAAADAMERLYQPGLNGQRDFADVLAWMRPWFERQKLPVPTSIGDGMRTLAGALTQPHLSRQDRAALYGQASIFATRESKLAAELGSEVQWQTDAAVRAAHVTALQAADAVEKGHPVADAAASIAAAAGPRHPAIARGQAEQLARSLAAYPDQGGRRAQIGRALGAIPGAFLGLGVLVLGVVVISFRSLAGRYGLRQAVETSLLLLSVCP